MLNYLLFYRLIIFNTLGVCALLVAYWMGYVTQLVHHDAIGAAYVIAGLLGLGIFGSLVRGWKVSRALNHTKTSPVTLLMSDVKKMPYKNEYLRDMAEWTVLVGLAGNAMGFILALSGGTDSLLAGAGTAFGSTVAGIIAALWLGVNFSMIRTATGLLIEDAS